MSEDLLSRLVPRIRSMEGGGYKRAYIYESTPVASETHQLVAQILDSIKVPYRTGVRLADDLPEADFFVNGTAIFVDREIRPVERRRLASMKAKCVLIRRDSLRSDSMDHGLRVVGLEEEGHLQTIFMDDPSFSFDYAHILPKTEKCSVMHGHTSSVLVELIGRPLDGMVVDFAVAKDAIRAAVRSLDHKLFINEAYVTAVTGDTVSMAFDTVHGEFAIKAPKATTVLMKGEATVENLAGELLGRVAPRMPANVTAVGVYVYEGLNKGSHLLARIHQRGVDKRRRKR